MNKKIWTYSAIAYFVTWSIAFGNYWLFKTDKITHMELSLFHSLAAIGPALAAVISTYFFYGKKGLRRLFSKLKIYRPDRQTAFLILSPLVFFAIGLFIFRIIKNEWYSFAHFGEVNLSSFESVLAWLLPLLTYAILEEIGWRGFLLPHLQAKYSAWISTLFLALIWALWHLPFFFYRFDFSLGISIGFFFGIFVGAIILTSIYNSCDGFLTPVILFHFLNNFCSEFDKETIVIVLSVGFIFLAIWVYLSFDRNNLSKVDRMKIYF